LGLPFQAVAAEVEEGTRSGEAPASTALRLSLAKAHAVAALHPHALVLGCDTIVAFHGEVLGKPADAQEAQRMLTLLQGCTHTVFTGLALVGRQREVTQQADTKVTMRDYTNAELAAYVASDNPLDKAGAYAIQHRSFHPVASWEGCYANVVGLPLCHVVAALELWEIISPIDVPRVCQAHTGQQCAVFQDILHR
jgi:MAF protein